MVRYVFKAVVLLATCSLSAQIRDITNEQELQDIIGHDKVVIKFYSPACGICNAIEKSFDLITQDDAYKHVTFGRINARQYGQLAGQFRIRAYPTFILFRNGNEVKRQSGVYSTNATSFKTEMNTLLDKTFTQ